MTLGVAVSLPVFLGIAAVLLVLSFIGWLATRGDPRAEPLHDPFANGTWSRADSAPQATQTPSGDLEDVESLWDAVAVECDALGTPLRRSLNELARLLDATNRVEGERIPAALATSLASEPWATEDTVTNEHEQRAVAALQRQGATTPDDAPGDHSQSWEGPVGDSTADSEETEAVAGEGICSDPDEFWDLLAETCATEGRTLLRSLAELEALLNSAQAGVAALNGCLAEALAHTQWATAKTPSPAETAEAVEVLSN